MSFTVEKEIGGRKLIIETGKMARLAHGAVTVQYGETIILATAVAGKMPEPAGFLPLSVEYKEKTSAVGKIPGGFYKREGRPTTKEILTMRLIDRPLRPLFPKHYRSHEIQVIVSVLSADQENDPDIISMIGASAALSLAGLPFGGPTGSVRVGRIDNQFVLNPTHSQLPKSDMNIVVTATEKAIMMVEAGCDEVPEETVIEAILFAQEQIQGIVGMQKELMSKAGAVAYAAEPEKLSEQEEKAYQAVQQFKNEISDSLLVKAKRERSDSLDELFTKIKETLLPATMDPATAPFKEDDLKEAYEKFERELVRELIKQGKRLDGRGWKDIRPIRCEVNMLPRTHGSALFTRGETQALVTTTLGTALDEQVVDGLQPEFSKRFMLHYNFPPFCVGEAKPLRGPSRREIGHGALAERALEAVLPEESRFPYTIRVVSDILESNGSSSMATICGGTLSMMDAGVPIKKPVGGIAMGLIKEANEFYVLSDILGAEDHYGDMDFKVAGTQRGITALQMDIKTDGVNREILTKSLDQAREGRIHILREMMIALDRPRKEISAHAPRVIQMRVNPEKIALIIGTGGKNIRSLQESTGSTIQVKDDGTVTIYCDNKEGAWKTQEMIEQMVEEVKVGKIYKGKVTSVKDFGAFVEIAPGLEGLVHVSELEKNFVQNVNDVVKIGDEIVVKVLAVDDQNRIKLSKRAVEREEGKRKSP